MGSLVHPPLCAVVPALRTHTLWLNSHPLLPAVHSWKDHGHSARPPESQDIGFLGGLIRLYSSWPSSVCFLTYWCPHFCPCQYTYITYNSQLLSDPGIVWDPVVPLRIHPIIKDGIFRAQDIGSDPGGQWTE